ncbi:YIP1 family protein [Clostridium saccharoperbutylacetonicum]|uniref:YIP1 family protein n=1 Tax=Clostridium saccharoperbutylacetonicum TaxID=36745 RepID=UPI0039EAFA2B
MRIVEILKSPFKGVFSNSQLKMKESLIINLILACVSALAVIISAKTLVSDFVSGIVMLGLGSIIDQMMLRMFVLLVINFILIILVFSGIIFIISNMIFKLKISYEEYVSICTYANIIPTVIMIAGLICSLFSVTLFSIVVMIQICVLIILTYEGLSSMIMAGKGKIIYSIAITYVINAILFVAANYYIIESMIESRFRSIL